MEWIRRRYRLRKWALIGNDYVWPRASNRYAKSWLAEMNASLAYERYVPFSAPDLAVEVEAIEKSGAEALLISLIGQDAVDFNRIFGHMGLDRRILRLTCVIEENGLLASGAENLKRLFCASSYFGALATDANACFRETYHNFHGDRAPVLGALGQSTYEGMHFLATLMGDGRKDWREHCVSATGPAGTALIFGDSLVHASPNNMSPWDRPIFSVIYNPVSNALTRHRRPDYIHHRDTRPVKASSPDDDDGRGICFEPGTRQTQGASPVADEHA